MHTNRYITITLAVLATIINTISAVFTLIAALILANWTTHGDSPKSIVDSGVYGLIIIILANVVFIISTWGLFAYKKYNWSTILAAFTILVSLAIYFYSVLI